MRGSVAKRLRREAKRRTVGLPERGYAKAPNGNNAVVPVQTTRGLYRMFKRQWKKGLIQL